MKFIRRHLQSEQSGFITLASVIALGAVAMFLMLALVSQSVSFSQISVFAERSARAQSAADACAEKALDAIRQDENYAGDETVVIAGVGCQILPVQKSGAEYTISVSGTDTTAVRKNKIIADRVGTTDFAMQIVSWQEIGDF